MALAVDVLHSIREAGQEEWDGVVEASDAPVFYRYGFLLSYERWPLQNLDLLMYLIVREDGRAIATLPLHLQTKPDPLSALERVLGEPEPRALLTHVLHCYDTRLPALRLNEEIIDTVSETLAGLAGELKAGWFGFLNVDASAELFQLLRSSGFATTAMDSRYQLNLVGTTLDALLASRPRKFRGELLRNGRRAREAGTEVAVNHPPLRDLDRVVELFRLTASKHETAAYYPPDKLADFLHGIGDAVRLISLKLDETLLAAAACFQDRRKFHMWAGGVRYDLTAFSPYYVLFHEIMKTAYDSGSEIAEGGRGNARFKERFGMNPVPLFACIRRA